jgi:hypothetical protein
MLAGAVDLERLVGFLTVGLVVVALAMGLEGLELLGRLIQAAEAAEVQGLGRLEQVEQEDRESLLFDIQIPIL